MKYLHKLITMLLFVLFHFALIAGWQNGDIAPDWELKDIEGKTHRLHDVLHSGKHVILQFAATWCKSSWKYHKSGRLKTIWDMYGPEGTDEVMIFFIESDLSTGTKCLYGSSGCTGGTSGNWVSGTNFPIINLTGKNGNNIAAAYKIKTYPSLFVINANDKRCFKAGQPTIAGWQSWLFQSFRMTYLAECVTDEQLNGAANLSLTVFNGAGTKKYLWNNGEINAHLKHLADPYYTCKITDRNGYFIHTDKVFVHPKNESTDLSESHYDIQAHRSGNELNAQTGSPSSKVFNPVNIEDQFVQRLKSGQSESLSTVMGQIPVILRLYPNPASVTLSVEMEFKQASSTIMTIYDSVGRIAERSEINVSATQIFDVSRYDVGVYFLTLRCGDEFIARKFFIVR
jgi:hypothetical protein